MLPDYITNCLHKIAKNERFTDYKFETAAGSSHGDNFLGVMTAVTLSGTRRDDNGKVIAAADKLHLICKVPPANAVRQKNFNSAVVFDREIFMYSKMLPAFTQFQHDRGLSATDSFRSYPKVYACEVNKEKATYILIMEDLKAQNYDMYPKEKVIEYEHQMLVMRELGKFHAVSFAMKDQRPHEFEEYKQLKDLFINVFSKGTIKCFISKSIARATDAVTNPHHKRVMNNFLNTFVRRVDLLKTDAYCNEFGVMAHSDCWNNNFMFQYSDENKKQLLNVCFVDWQLTHYCPPVIDLLYNIFSSTDKPFRDQHYEKMIRTYYTSLSETIRKLGSDPNKLYTYDNLQMQLRKYSDYALMLAPLIIAIRVAKAKDVANLDDYAECLERGEDRDIIGQFDAETQAEFSRQINDLITDLIDYGYVKSV